MLDLKLRHITCYIFGSREEKTGLIKDTVQGKYVTFPGGFSPWHLTLFFFFYLRDYSLLLLFFSVPPVNLIDLKSCRGGRWRGQTEEEKMKRSREEEHDTELSCWQMCWAHCCSALTRWENGEEISEDCGSVEWDGKEMCGTGREEKTSQRPDTWFICHPWIKFIVSSS